MRFSSFCFVSAKGGELEVSRGTISRDGAFRLFDGNYYCGGSFENECWRKCGFFFCSRLSLVF